MIASFRETFESPGFFQAERNDGMVWMEGLGRNVDIVCMGAEYSHVDRGYRPQRVQNR